MESTSTKMKIQCSDITYRLLMDAEGHEFDLEKRLEDGVAGVHAKGKGQVSTWWINGATPRKGQEYIKVVENVGRPPNLGPNASRDSLDTMERAGISNDGSNDADRRRSDDPDRRKSITFEDETLEFPADMNLSAADIAARKNIDEE